MNNIITKKINTVLKRKLSRKYEFHYLRYSKKPIKKNTILVESTHGREFSGHIFYMVKEIQKNYPNLEIYLSIKSSKLVEVKEILDRQNFDGKINIIEFLSKEYAFALATSEYLINDTSFWDFFNKRPEQKYINIWHGTPLKYLGKDIEPDGFGNVQKNFLSADYLVVSNEYTKEKMVQGFNLENIASTKVLVGPSPRNSVLFDDTLRVNLRAELDIEEKKVFFYMPTYRDKGTSINVIEETLTYIDQNLSDGEKMFIKLHPFDEERLSLNLSGFNHIFEYPKQFETYEFLTVVDCLITDYSSILYDFSCTGREIILYTYDKEEYYLSRGMYENIDDYPFVQAKNKEKLIELMLHSIEIDSDGFKLFREKFVPFDNINGVSEIVDYIFDDRKNDNIQEHTLRNSKENIVFFAGGLWDNGISRAFFNTIESIDLTEKNYILYVKDKSVKKEHKYKLNDLKIPYVLSAGIIQYNFLEGILTYLYLNTEWFGKSLGKKFIEKVIFKMYQRDFQRMFNGLDIKQFIHYTGFERSLAAMLSSISAIGIKTTIFYHTDIFEEYKAKKNVNMKVLSRTYETSDQLVVVNKELQSKLIENFPYLKNIIVLDNFLGFREIREKSNENIFLSFLGVPLQYGYAEELFNEYLSTFNKLEKENLNVSNKIIPIIKRHHLGVEGVFPYLQKHILEFREIFKNQLESKNSDFVNIEQIEMGHIYGSTKMKLLNDLLNPKMKVFINIGRFAVEKSHDRLIDAFIEINKKYPNTRLVIVAPHGPLKRETISRVVNSGIKDCITILGGMDNPYPLLKFSDAFVFTSLYEGLGLVVFEALAVGTDVITVDIPATTEGIIRGSSPSNPAALILENSLDGIIQGWTEYMEHSLNFGDYDFETQEKQSLSMWNKIVNE